jgi:hypothetical protein
MMAAKSASLRQQDPVDGPLQGVPDADASKIDGSAMRTIGREHLALNTARLRTAADRRNFTACRSVARRRVFQNQPGMPRDSFTGVASLEDEPRGMPFLDGRVGLFQMLQ